MDVRVFFGGIDKKGQKVGAARPGCDSDWLHQSLDLARFLFLCLTGPDPPPALSAGLDLSLTRILLNLPPTICQVE
jgi:hypothetical protein